MLSIVDGLHVPLTPLLDVVGNNGAVAPAQMLVAKLNVGVVLGVTVTLIVTGKPHCPAAGVNVYVPLVVLLIVAGLQVPVRPFVELVGNRGAVVPAQKAGIAVNDGTKIGLDKITPEKRLIVVAFAVTEKPAYTPAFNPVIVAWPALLATIVTGPTGLPSSVYVIS